MKITKKEAAKLAGISEKTIERHIADVPENDEYKAAVGFERRPNGRVTFDAKKFKFFYGITDKLDFTEKPKVVEAVIIPPKENRKLQRRDRSDDLVMLADALMLPFERVLTLKQARIESGLSERLIKQGIETGKIKARRVNFRKQKLKGKEFLVSDLRISLISLKKFVVEYLE